MATQALDDRLTVDVARGRREGGAAVLAEVRLIVTGAVASPSLQPDLESVARAVASREVNERLQQKSDDLRKKLGDKLKDLFGH